MPEQMSKKVRSSGWRRHGRRTVVSAVAVAAAGAVAAGALAPSATASSAAPDPVQQGLNALVSPDSVPGALASVTDRDGRTRTYTAGVGDIATGAKVPRDGQVRIGSNTKAFMATVVLQLVGEQKIRLDAKVDAYLPGVLRGDGIDGRKITIRHLLQHRSGLPSYVDYLDEDIHPYEPRELLARALKHKAHFKPGDKGKWEYNNTNYLVLGLIVEKLTHRSIAQEIDRRIVKRIGLRHTYFPAHGDATIKERHPRGYYQSAAGAPLVDATEWDPSWAWAAGQMVSTNTDLNRFYTALLGGRLLEEPELEQMRKTVDATYPFPKGAGYGLGLVKTPLACGGVYWGHGGSMTGYETRGGVVLKHGKPVRAVNVAVTTQPGKTVKDDMDKIVNKALCR
ncbi:serine hydrolase domain-containing protein [Streptomyces spectabilis]|uniref:Class A beta-lactamase-related serine hydrolase n=1 Tax=Streptomyces spectabilis TaxID=68270 RepID=A0A5P2XHC2_STRST|nr:serine hydrolase domain-containing protein [Streptomyces spectabilis]MBB5105023.1 D-alanyl-D-alanine carboxypeptidase [Streptomyces spectabilis]MCI3905753.1 beta-lactamase family protein [Streptomyces spectabilis]QEV62699.1 class A beta-lactamase-related serine hydrolase [Streptomyces spectabilis]GGV06855.1 serine hydrolase [Streptomyces spectabilis]